MGDDDDSITRRENLRKTSSGNQEIKGAGFQKKSFSGYQVQDKDKDRDCDRHNNYCHRVDVNRTLIFALVIIDQTGG